MSTDFVKERQLHLARYAYALMSIGVAPEDFKEKMTEDFTALIAEGTMLRQVIKEAQS